MRFLIRVLLALVFAALVLGAGGTQDDPARVYSTPTVAIVFDDAYTAEGIALERIDVEIRDPAGAFVAAWELTEGWRIEGASFRVPIHDLAAPLANGTYQMTVRVWDTYGNVSGWSNVLWARKQWIALPAPGGCATVR